jgi:TolA-binding protein
MQEERVYMKKSGAVFQLLLLSIVIMIQFACTPIPEESKGDSYFTPVDSIRRQNIKQPTTQKLDDENIKLAYDENIKKSMLESLLEEDKHVDELLNKLNLSTNKASSVSPTETNPDGKIPIEMLLRMIRDRNRRLEDIVEQIRHSTKAQEKNQQEEPVQQKILSGEMDLSYGEAIKLYRQKEYAKAIQLFQTLLKQGIDVTLQDNCYFWEGVCYFNLKKTNHALNEFFKVLEIPDSDKREGAYFMIGQCYERMGIKSNAKAMFKRVVWEYPESDLKQVAEIKIALLK